jgi:DNA processing protein
VVEAALQSGALITARCSAEYGKDVFAVPGSIYSEFSKGTNMLIKEGAGLALSPEELENQAPYFDIPQEQKIADQPLPPNSISAQEQSVLDLIALHDEGIHPDEIAQQMNIEISNIAAIILKLEINGMIKSMPGQLYVKVR